MRIVEEGGDPSVARNLHIRLTQAAAARGRVSGKNLIRRLAYAHEMSVLTATHVLRWHNRQISECSDCEIFLDKQRKKQTNNMMRSERREE